MCARARVAVPSILDACLSLSVYTTYTYAGALSARVGWYTGGTPTYIFFSLLCVVICFFVGGGGWGDIVYSI